MPPPRVEVDPPVPAGELLSQVVPDFHLAHLSPTVLTVIVAPSVHVSRDGDVALHCRVGDVWGPCRLPAHQALSMSSTSSWSFSGTPLEMQAYFTASNLSLWSRPFQVMCSTARPTLMVAVPSAFFLT